MHSWPRHKLDCSKAGSPAPPKPGPSLQQTPCPLQDYQGAGAALLLPGAEQRPAEELLTALRKGTHLRKYGRRGSPKYHMFKLSADDKELQWQSSNVGASAAAAAAALAAPRAGAALPARHAFLDAASSRRDGALRR
jgi:hypothetical protein